MYFKDWIIILNIIKALINILGMINANNRLLLIDDSKPFASLREADQRSLDMDLDFLLMNHSFSAGVPLQIQNEELLLSIIV